MPDSSPFAQRTDWPLSPNQYSATLKSLRNDGIKILDLTESNPTNCGFTYSADNIIDSLKNKKNLCYEPTSRGNIQAREALSCYYKEKGLEVDPQQIFLTSSTSEAYSYLFRLLVNPGEGVLFPGPSYPLFSFLGDLNDVRIEPYPLVYNNKWNIDLTGMRQVLKDDIKAIVAVNPNNPTGSFISGKELEAINLICQEKNISLICDEVFSDFVINKTSDHISLVSNDQVLTFVLGGISKTLGLPQMKLSWIIVNGPQDLVKASIERLEVIADTYLSVNTPTQNAFPLWLSCRKAIQGEINERIKANYDLLNVRMSEVVGCEVLLSDGGWYAVIKIPDTLSEEQWVLNFLNEDHVAVHPGYFFDFPAEAYIIVSLLPLSEVFEDGIGRIAKRIANQRSKIGARSQTY